MSESGGCRGCYAAGSSLASDGRFNRRCNAIDRIGFLDHRRVVEFRWRRIDVPTGRDDEWHIFFAQPRCNRPDVLAFQIHIEDSEVETALLDFLERAFNRVAGPADAMTQRIEEVLEHHRDERFILDNQYGTPARHLAFA